MTRTSTRHLSDAASPLCVPLRDSLSELLRAVGLVVSQKEGTTRICDLNAKLLRVVHGWLRDYQALWDQSLRNLKSYIEYLAPRLAGGCNRVDCSF